MRETNLQTSDCLNARCFMNLKTKIEKIENVLNVNAEFCRCGTSYFNAVVAGQGSITTEICPGCERKVKPLTIAEFVKAAHYEINLILPKLES